MGRLQIITDKCLLQKIKLEKSTVRGRGFQGLELNSSHSPSTIPDGMRDSSRIPSSRPLSTPAEFDERPRHAFQAAKERASCNPHSVAHQDRRKEVKGWMRD